MTIPRSRDDREYQKFADVNSEVAVRVTDVNGGVFSQMLTNLVLQTAVTVTTSATKLPTTNLTSRKLIVIYNNSAQIVYLGNAAVTTTDGLPVPVGQTITIDADENVDLYAIATAGTANIRLLEGE